jgi:hypothetical protein
MAPRSVLGGVRGVRGIAFVLASAGAAACILTISPLPETSAPFEGGTTPDASPAGDDGGAPAEGGPSDDGGDSGSVPNLVANGGFEAAASGIYTCGLPWGWFQANLALDPTARSGGQACRVCADPGAGAGASFAINWDAKESSPTVAAGVSLSARAWVRALPGQPADQHVITSIRVYDGGALVSRCDGPAVAPGSSFAPADCSFVPAATGALNVYIHSDGPPDAGECFLVDDVEVTAGK